MQVTEGAHPGEHLAIALTGGGEGSRFDNPILLIDDRCDVKILMGIHAADDATCSFVYRHSQPPALTSTNGFAGPNARTGQSRDHEGQALLGSQASARQSLTARRSRAVDRSRERHGWSIGVRVRPHRAPHGASLPVGRSVFRVRPPGNWRLSSDCRSDATAHPGARAARSPLTTRVTSGALISTTRRENRLITAATQSQPPAVQT